MLIGRIIQTRSQEIYNSETYNLLKGIENEKKLVNCPPCHKITAPDSMIRVLTLKLLKDDKREPGYYNSKGFLPINGGQNKIHFV